MGLTMDENHVSVEHIQTFPILIPSAIQSHRFLHTICIAFGMISNLEIKSAGGCAQLCFPHRDLSIHSPQRPPHADNKGWAYAAHCWTVFFQVGEFTECVNYVAARMFFQKHITESLT